MTTTQIIFVIAIVMIVVLALRAFRNGPRITTIEHTHDKDRGDER